MNMRKIIAILSAVLMLCSVIPMGALSVPVFAAEEVAYLADFENNSLGGWQNDAGGMSVVSTSELPVANAATGNYVVKKVKPAGDWGFLEDRTAFAIEPNTDYLVTVDVMPIANQAYPLQAFVSTGTWITGVLGTSEAVKCPNEKWSTLSFTFNSGENTEVYASIKSTWDNCTYYFDNFKVAKLDPYRDVVINGGFETGDLTGWNKHQTVSVTGEAAHDGSYGVRLQDNGTWGGIMDQTVAVVAGKTYEVSFWIKVNKFGVNLQIRDGSSSGANLTSDSTWYSVAAHSDWTLKTYTVTPTTNAIFFNFCGGGDGTPDPAKETDTYVDSFTVKAVKEPSFDGYIYNGDFELGKIDFGTHEVNTIGAWVNLWGWTTLEQVEGHNGDYAIKGTANAWQQIYQPVAVTPNTNYTVACYSKDAADTALWIKNSAGQGDLTNTALNSGSDWGLTSLSFNSGSNSVVWIGLMCLVNGATYTVDDVVMFESAEQSNDGYIVNGTFETGDTTGWTNLWNSCPKAEIVFGGKDDNFALHIVSGQWKHVRQTPIAVEPNTNYKITVWSKNSSNISLLVKGLADDKSTETFDINNVGLNSGAEWTQFTNEFNSGDHNYVIVSFMGNTAEGAEGTFDNIVMEKLHVCEYVLTDGVWPTCETPGSNTYTCSVCGASYTEEIPAYHNGNLEYNPAKEPVDCATPGNIEHYYCPGCYEYFSDANATELINPWYIEVTVDCVKPEGLADCADWTCEICGNENYGYGEHDTGVPACQDGHCSKCDKDIAGYGHQNYDGPACLPGNCYYCGEAMEPVAHENGAWAPCLEGECSYGCGLTYPAAAEHVDEDGDHHCDVCWSVLPHDCIDEDGDNSCDICYDTMPHDCIDEDGDHRCDICWGVMPHDCIDEDGDNWCDVCWSRMPVLYGDADGNGEVNGLDEVLLAQYNAGWEVELGA